MKLKCKFSYLYIICSYLELYWPGCPVAVPSGVPPGVHLQSASPSSNPLDLPSWSESFWQNSGVHTFPEELKSWKYKHIFYMSNIWEIKKKKTNQIWFNSNFISLFNLKSNCCLLSNSQKRKNFFKKSY